MAACYEEDKNYKKSNDYLIKYSNLYQEVYSSAKFEEIYNLNSKYEYEVKQKDILLIQTQNKLNTAKLSQKQFQNKILISGIFLSVFIIVFLIFSYIKKENKNRILTEKNENLIKLASKNSILNKFNYNTSMGKSSIDNLLANKLISLMEKEEVYLDANITMTELPAS